LVANKGIYKKSF